MSSRCFCAMSPVLPALQSLLFALVSQLALAQAPVSPAAPAIAAKSYLLIDTLSGQALAAENAAEPREPASLTKLMTAYLVFRALKEKELLPSQTVNVSE